MRFTFRKTALGIAREIDDCNKQGVRHSRWFHDLDEAERWVIAKRKELGGFTDRHGV